MYICNCCDSVFGECKIIEEPHPYGESTATEKWAVCPYCEETDISEAKECKRCGGYAAELHDDLCECCYGEMYGE